MLDAVFISDLHLHPEDKNIKERFDAFVEWAKTSVKKIYILGDFFHAWAGDDSINEWSRAIALQLSELARQGISIYFMHGNRDFLLGKEFARLACWTILPEPTLITLGEEQILLVHGDRYCTKDRSHQRLRILTRNWLFTTLFLKCSLNFRERLVSKVRNMSLSKSTKSVEEMDVVSNDVVGHMAKLQITTLIHGHTHKPGITRYTNDNKKFTRYVLSDWDDMPQLLCYDNTKGLFFTHLALLRS